MNDVDYMITQIKYNSFIYYNFFSKNFIKVQSQLPAALF
ncbi:MAG: hypothetical protein RL172_1769 [Bacteroidota bacterium]|jgi:hypothetical protein